LTIGVFRVADSRLVGLIRHLRSGLASKAGKSDRESLRAFLAQKDEAAFETLVQRHGPMVYRVCQRVLNNAQDAEDAFQATFLVLARKANSIRKTDSLASWLHGVAYRISMRAKRDAGRRRMREHQASVPQVPEPGEELAWRDVQALLEQEIQRLPRRYRDPFVLCFLEGRSRAETSLELGVNENTVSSRLARARERLQSRLAQRGISLSAVLAAITLVSETTGSLPAKSLMVETTRAALQFAARQPVVGLSPFTLQLTKETVRTMSTAKLQTLVGTLALGSTLALGAWGLSQPPAKKQPGLPVPEGFSQIEPRVTKGEAPAAPGRAADYTQRQRSLKNLKQLMLAMHAYHDAYQKFPVDIVSKEGKPLLSWRVELLPFMEEDNLARAFNRDEPWDSEHNFKLLAKMPEVLRVGFEPKGTTHTYYQRFAISPLIAEGPGAEGAAGGMGSGPAGAGGSGAPSVAGGLPGGAAASGPPVGFGAGAAPVQAKEGFQFPREMMQITDGTSNTICMAEAGPAVPWTKPADFQYDVKKALPAMSWPFGNVHNVGMFDGVVMGLSPRLETRVFQAFVTPSNGEVLPDRSTMKARFPADSAEEKEALAQLQTDNQAKITRIQQELATQIDYYQRLNKGARTIDDVEEIKFGLEHLLREVLSQNDALRPLLGLPKQHPIPQMKDAVRTTTVVPK
jgi:RNA polymerase sigma factor (sigma-70 family)